MACWQVVCSKGGPSLQFLMVHNIDTLGANADPALLGWFVEQKAAMMFEVIARQFDDRGGDSRASTVSRV